MEEWEKIDERNLNELKNIINKYNWESILTKENISNLWVITQHADKEPVFQEKILKKISEFGEKKSEKLNDEEKIKLKEFLAMLEDRILTNKYHFQKYGSQWEKKTDERYLPVPVLKDIDWLNNKIDLFDIKTFYDIDFFDMSDSKDIEILNQRRKGNFPKDIEKIEDYAKKNNKWKIM